MRQRTDPGLLGALLLAALVAVSTDGVAAEPKPNVLLIAVDDLNDWVGYLDGHPDARTPNIDRLARGGVAFTNAHCAAPICNPSRTALLTGLRPSTSGCYMNKDWASDSPVADGAVTLPMHFQRHGYKTMVTGKITHAHNWGGRRMVGPERWKAMWDRNSGSFGGQNFKLKADEFPAPFEGVAGGTVPALHWGGLGPEKAKKLADPQVAGWAVERLKEDHEAPFFLAVGIHRPHTPLTMPQRFYEMFDPSKVKLPAVKEDDLEDVPWMGRQTAIAGYQEMEGGHHRQIQRLGHWREIVRAYLGATTFADAQVGRVLDALKTSEHADNTIVVLFSDHGWHLGERHHFEKWGLWEQTTRVPLVIRGPGVGGEGRSGEAVSLLDLYPTLVDLCGLPAPEHDLDGQSLRPLLEDPSTTRERPAITSFGRGNHAVRSERWRYIRWADGSEELYDHEADEREWRNLAGDPDHAAVKERLRRWLPETEAKPLSAAPPVRKVYRLRPGQRMTWRAIQPHVAHQPITVRARIHAKQPTGVILYHSGRMTGYSLYVKDDRLCMGVMDVPDPLRWDRLHPGTTVARSVVPVPDEPVDVEGRLHADGRITLRMGGRRVGEAQTDGPLSAHPAGTMIAGQAQDTRYPPAGDYRPAESEFHGTIENLRVGFGKAPFQKAPAE